MVVNWYEIVEKACKKLWCCVPYMYVMCTSYDCTHITGFSLSLSIYFIVYLHVFTDIHVYLYLFHSLWYKLSRWGFCSLQIWDCLCLVAAELATFVEMNFRLKFDLCTIWLKLDLFQCHKCLGDLGKILMSPNSC